MKKILDGTFRQRALCFLRIEILKKHTIPDQELLVI